jgi:predicted phage terminase large subunit-like protein
LISSNLPKLTNYIPHTPTAKQMLFLKYEGLDAFYGGAAGGGKALSADSCVCTPFGFRKISDLKVGDRICTVNGSNCQVIGVYPQGKQQLYAISFSDGSSVKATQEHIWKYSVAQKGKWRKSGLQYKLGLTGQLKELMDQDYSVLIPLCAPVQFTKSYKYDLRQIHPYVLGCLLGDGSVTISPVKMHSADPEIISYMEKVTGHTWHRYGDSITYRVLEEDSKELTYWLKKNKLFGHNHYNKFIPDNYKYNSIEGRFELLRGLLDTDGYCSTGGKVYFSSASKQLALDVQWIVRSLGGNATLKKKVGSYTKDGQRITTTDNYSVYIRMVDNSLLFNLSRKKELAQQYNGGRFDLKKRIEKIEKVEIADCICIKVDHPDGLFITDDFIVTHNSDALLMAALQYMDIPGYNALLIRDTYANLTKPGGLLDRSNEWLSLSDAKWNGDMKAWIFPTGATLSFGYIDGPRDHFNYQGAEYQFVGIDEAVNIREHQAIYLFSRLRKKNPESYRKDLKVLTSLSKSQIEQAYQQYLSVPLRFRCASNPPRIEQKERGDWVKQRYVDVETREGRIFIPAKIADNPHLNQAEYRTSLKELDPITRKQLEDGDWNIQVSGRFFNRTWFEIVDKSCNADDTDMVVRYWDLAATEEDPNKDPAYTVGLRMRRSRFGIYYIESVIRKRLSPRNVEQLIRQTADMDGKSVLIGMEQEPGSAGVNNINNYRTRVLPEFAFFENKKTGSKIDSARPVAAQAEAGNIKIVQGAWNGDLLDEVELFPGKFKDQVDALSGAYEMLSSGVGARARWL